MNPDWLAQLAPAHPPPAPGVWPLALGWWLLLALLLTLGAAGWLWLASPRRALRRAALTELAAIRARAPDRVALAQGLESLLRRYALAVLPRERVAPLTGEAWLALLAAEGAGALAGAAGRSLLAAAFGGAGSDDRSAWLTGAEAFVRRAGARPWQAGIRSRSR
jgi:hypothetical protein